MYVFKNHAWTGNKQSMSTLPKSMPIFSYDDDLYYHPLDFFLQYTCTTQIGISICGECVCIAIYLNSRVRRRDDSFRY